LLIGACPRLFGAARDAPGPILTNGDFEAVAAKGNMPSGWTPIGSHITLTTAACHSATHAVKFTCPDKAGAFEALITHVPIDPDARYTFTLYVRNNRHDRLSGPCHGMLCIEWLDAHDNEIQRTCSPHWSSTLTGLKWKKISIRKVRPPPGTTQAVVGIHLVADGSSAKGSFFADDVTMKRK